MRTYVLFETANTHNGSKDKLIDLINSLPSLKNTGVKLQVFKFDRIALKDYGAYKAYQHLFFDKKTWKQIIKQAKNRGFDVWIDVFDLYGIEVLKDNLPLVTGIKLQSSVLDNLKVLKALSGAIKNKKIKVVLNIAGRELENIKKLLADLCNGYFDNKIILQAGFQTYPTDVEDLLVDKIHLLRKNFPDIPISYADHVDGRSSLAFEVPAFAVLAGASHIEKHVCLDRTKTKYDHNSALEPHEARTMVQKIEGAEKILGSGFISRNEKNYLRSTIEKPIAPAEARSGDLIGFGRLDFKRTSQKGLTAENIRGLMKHRYIFRSAAGTDKAVSKEMLRRARIGVIVACRMKSTRLKHKAILPIAGLASIERCLINAKNIRGYDEIILATSTVGEDRVLKKYARKQEVRFFAGEPDDVIKRYLAAADKYKLDVIIRITGDCPIISSEIAEHLLAKHFESGADYTAAKKCPWGLNSEIYNVNTLKKVIGYAGCAPHSEYMTWYITNNPHVFDINMIDLPESFLRDYRLTLDEQADLDMFNALFDKLGKLKPNMKNVYKVLDANPSIPRMNSSVVLKFKTNKKLMDMLNRETRLKIPEK